MEIELVQDGKINTGMQSYIKEEIKKKWEDVSKGVTSPETIILLDVTEGDDKCLEEKPQPFNQQWQKCCG